MDLQLDDWQKEVLATQGNICLVSGRQTGKSTIAAIKSAEFVVKNPKKFVLVVSVTEKQAEEMLLKILNYLADNHKSMIKKGKDKPTKHKITLTNGSIVRCEPVGQTGYGIRGFTIDLLIADEAAFMPEEIWPAITPMLLTTGGDIFLISTPHGKTGYFYQCYVNPQFKTFHINSLAVAEGRPEPRRTIMLHHLESEKVRLTKNQFAQEYLGQFVEELNQFFPDAVIKSRMIMERPERIIPARDYYLGVDVARLGADESTFEVVEKRGEYLFHVENIITEKTRITDTVETILHLNAMYSFKKIYIDDGGVGAGVFDYLLKEEATRRKVEAINNAARSLDRDESRKKKLLKEDLYTNLLRLMERGEIMLLKDESLFLSLKSVQYEYKDNGELLIHGNYTHVVEGLIRAAWCWQDKSLNIWMRIT